MRSPTDWWTSWRDNLFVYVMRGENLRKIGVSTDPVRRMKEVERSTGQQIDLEFFVSHPTRYWLNVERAVHRALSDKRHHGEWFDVTQAEVRDWFRLRDERRNSRIY